MPVRIEGGKLLLDNRAELAEAIRHFPDGDAVLIVKRASISTIRSEKANKYYWSCVLHEMAKENSAGDQTPEQIHDAMCEMFLPNEQKRVEFFNRMTGELLAVDTDHRRSSKLKGEPFYVFVEQVRKFALEFLGVRTEDPDPNYWRKRQSARSSEARSVDQSEVLC